MQPVQLSLIVGEKGSGVSTLLETFRARADMKHTLIIDEDGTNGVTPRLTAGWESDAINAWLKSHRAYTEPVSTSHIVFAASNLRAARHLLRALARSPELSLTYRLTSLTGVASAWTWTEAAGRVCAGGDEASAETDEHVAIDPQLQRLFATADRIVLTHCDRARPEAVTKLAKQLKAMNPPAPILRARHGDIGPARLVDSGLFDPIDGSIDIDRWLCEAAFGFEAARRGGLNLPETALSRLSNDVGVQSFAVTIDQPLDSIVLSVFLKLLMADRGTDLLRLKGIVATEDHADRPALIDGREHLIQPLLWLETWPTADRRGRLVFTTADTSEDWIRTLLTTLSDQLKLQAMPELQMAMMEKVG